MNSFHKFFIKGFSFKNNIASFYYSFDNKVFFVEEINFNIWKKIVNFDKNILYNLLTNLSIALWISYYKLYPYAKIQLPVMLNSLQLKFWNKFYTNWLWEFFFQNKINPWVINFVNGKNNFNKTKWNIEKQNNSLLLWGWGKDSIVWYSLIKNKYDYDLFIVWKIDRIKQETANIIWKQPLLVKRKLSKTLLKLNEKYYNWHIPITWIISFISLIIAYLYWYNYIFTSNEKSAWEENIIWKWYKINHQYSKSLEFENDFINYNLAFLWWIEYKSILSSMSEIDIVQKFVKLEEFFPYFSSCNKNFKITWSSQSKRWCCNCEKCAFVYLLLSAYLPQKKVINIFWEDLFENEWLLKTYKWLLWIYHKPFECVWTYKESKKALELVLKKYKNKKLPFILNNMKYILE